MTEEHTHSINVAIYEDEEYIFGLEAKCNDCDKIVTVSYKITYFVVEEDA